MTKNTHFNWLNALRIGLIGGVVALLISLVGMVEEFGQRDIIAGVISMGQTLLIIAMLMGGHFAAARSVDRPGPLSLAGGALAGLVTSGMLAVLVLLIGPLNMRAILPNASPALINILTFEQGPVPGLFYLLGAGALVGVVAGLLHILPPLVRQAIILALFWVALLGLLQELLRVTLTNMPAVGAALSWMFGSGTQKGLSVPGAIAVAGVVAGGNYLWATRGAQAQARVRAMPPARQRALQWGSLALAIAVVLYLPNILGPYLSEVANNVGLFILMGLGLNIVVGFAGLLDLGYVAFYAIGAYAMGVLTTTGGELSTSFQLSFWQALPIAVVVAVAFGVLLGVPVLKMRGDYLAIVTLGFGEI